MSMGAGAAEGLKDVLQRLFLEAQFKQSQKEHANRMDLGQQELGLRGRGLDIQETGNAQDYELGQGNLALGGRRVDLDQSELGEKVRQFDALGPQRAADVAQTGAVTGELLRKPQAEEQERTFLTGRDKTLHGYRIGETAAEGAEQRRTLGARQSGGSGGQQNTTDNYTTERTTRTRDGVTAIANKVSPWTTGPGSLLSYFPGTDATDFQAEVESLAANIAFNELTEMRNASKTGGALGQVSNIELKLLESALGSLDPRQSPAAFKAQLDKIMGSLDRWDAAKKGAGGGGAAPGPTAPPQETPQQRLQRLQKLAAGGQ
jgi:hypothetical protein